MCIPFPTLANETDFSPPEKKNYSKNSNFYLEFKQISSSDRIERKETKNYAC